MNYTSPWVVPAVECPATTWYAGVSESFSIIVQSQAEATRHYTGSVSQQPVDCRFAELAATWRAQTEFMSSASDMFLSQPYQRVIALGEAVVPLILGELRQRPDHWHWALSAITGVDPVPDEARGNVKAMAAAWVQWGADQGLVA